MRILRSFYAITLMLSMNVCVGQKVQKNRDSLFTNQLTSDRKLVVRAGVQFPIGLKSFVSAETKLFKRLTLSTELGTAFSYGRLEWADTDPRELEDVGKIGVVGFISPEVRYYYRILHRGIKSDRYYRNFSGHYVALKYFVSTPSTIYSTSTRASYENAAAWQINLGSQFQYRGRVYLGLFGGAVINHRKLNSSYISLIPLLQFGITAGIVL